jgi:hypothetical protein
MSQSSFAIQQNKFRGSRYPGFTSGPTDAAGNFTAAPSEVAQGVNSDVSTTQSPDKAALSTDTGGIKTQFVDKPSGDSFGGAVTQAAAPYIGSTFGSAAGQAIQSGAANTIGEALSAGASGVGSSISGNLNSFTGGLLGTSSGTSGAITTVGAGGEGISQAVGSGAEAIGSGSIGGVGSISGALGSFGSGIGTFVGGLLSGQSTEKALASGIGSGIGAAIGSFIPIPGGTIIGSFLGSLVGGLFGPKPSVGPNGNTNLVINDNGYLGVGTTGADNGADKNVTIGVANSSVDAVNKWLDSNNYTLKGKDYGLYKDSSTSHHLGFNIIQGNDKKTGYKGQRSAADVFNYLNDKGLIVKKSGVVQPNSATSSEFGSGTPTRNNNLVPQSPVKDFRQSVLY